MLIGGAAVVPSAWAPASRANDLTVSQNVLRTGWDSAETTITPTSVKGFTQLFDTAVAGQVYAQPVVIDSLNTVVVATETDDVYGLNAATGAILWHTKLGTPMPITWCGDLTPDIGVTSGPVYDPTLGPNGTLLIAAETGGSSAPLWAIWEVNPVTGHAVQWKTISGHPANDSHISFTPKQDFARPGLLLMNGWVYAAFGSHCDHQPYAGYVAGVNVTSKALALWTDESGVTNNQAGIWQGGGGIMEYAPGAIYVTSGNGISPAYGAGRKPPGTLAESVIHLSANATTGALKPIDFFSPNNAPALDAADHDFGSGGPVGLPFGVSGGAKAHPHLMVQAGKDGRIFLLDPYSLGGRSSNNSGALYVSPVYSGLWGHPAVFADTTTLTSANAAAAHNYMYYVGKNDVLRVFKFGVSGSGLPTISDIANSALVYGYTSGSPIVTSDGTNAATAVVWVVYSPGSSGAGAILEAYDVSSTAMTGCSATHQCKLAPIFSAPIGTAVKFAVVATSAGRVYVGTRDNHVYGFGAPPAAAPLAATATALGSTPLSTATTKTVTTTATQATTVTGVSAATGASNATTPTGQFSVTKVTVTKKGKATPVTVTLPVKLAKGDKLNATVKFIPAAPGDTDGTLVVTSKSAAQPVVRIPLSAGGTQTALYAKPSSEAFPLAPDQGVTDVPVGTSVPGTVVVSNFGTSPYTITSVTPPSGAFSFTPGGVTPYAGQKLMPGQSISVAVSYSPLAPGPANGSFTIAGTSGGPRTSTTVTLSGIGTAAVSKVTAPAVDFGTIPAGKASTLYVHITNTGNTQAQIAGASALPAPFAAQATPQPGLPFNPSYDLYIPVTFTPKKPGKFSAHYTLKWTDMKGAHTLNITLTGTAK
jgi:hypothetical protein